MEEGCQCELGIQRGKALEVQARTEKPELGTTSTFSFRSRMEAYIQGASRLSQVEEDE